MAWCSPGRPLLAAESLTRVRMGGDSLFDCTLEEVKAGFFKPTLLVIAFSWSPSSVQMVKAVRDAGIAEKIAVRYMDGDSSLEFCTKNR